MKRHSRRRGVVQPCATRAAAGTGRLAALLMLIASQAQGAPRPDPRTLFNQAVTADLDSTATEGSTRALALYRPAADGGLAEAELNVAVLYDSGRGTVRDPALAADYYAASATGGLARAAFDLGQLYESGDGVPQNLVLAQAWFSQAAAEGLQAAANRPDHPAPPAVDTVPMPATRYPPEAANLPVPLGGLPLVWTAAAAPAPVSYFIQVMHLDGRNASPVFSTSTEVSALRMPSPRPGRYAWRVFTVCPSLGRYVASGWASFSLS